MATCSACTAGEHGYCSPIPDPDREMTFSECACLHDPVVIRRDARITALLVEAQSHFGHGDDAAMCIALHRILAEAEPRKSQQAAAAKPFRKFSVVGAGQSSTADCYAAASGEALPAEWLSKKHDSEKR